MDIMLAMSCQPTIICMNFPYQVKTICINAVYSRPAESLNLARMKLYPS